MLMCGAFVQCPFAIPVGGVFGQCPCALAPYTVPLCGDPSAVPLRGMLCAVPLYGALVQCACAMRLCGALVRYAYTVLPLCDGLVLCLCAYYDGVRAKPRNRQPYLVHKEKHRDSYRASASRWMRGRSMQEAWWRRHR